MRTLLFFPFSCSWRTEGTENKFTVTLKSSKHPSLHATPYRHYFPYPEVFAIFILLLQHLRAALFTANRGPRHNAPNPKSKVPSCGKKSPTFILLPFPCSHQSPAANSLDYLIL